MTKRIKTVAVNQYVKPLMMEVIKMGKHLGLQWYQYENLLKECYGEVYDGEE